ncbi:3TM-type holin [Grimontia sp. NTOU-MAR1]|uniref:3TM-type holin n=1 Tax=Grimontia sp. NTOU-MAR1 TaxID=3111011 RepID=UPI002DBBB4BE|nr:3TM-type holin [Grimontia sp. NTOU-MAR1]WRV99548.1 3TM-type holin [Grimontia sp. NTOU-MAR1]
MWETVKRLLGSAAPLIGTVIGGPAGSAVGAMVASTLGVEATPAAIEAELKANPDALLKIKELESEERLRLNDLAFQHAALESEERKLAMTTQAATQQAELASNDAYVRRWRPTFGYAMCLAWSLLFFGLAYALVCHPTQAAALVNAVVALTPLFTVALAVLGISIHKRSQDKQVAKGLSPPGLFGRLNPTSKEH